MTGTEVANIREYNLREEMEMHRAFTERDFERLDGANPIRDLDDPVYYGLVNDARQIAIMALHNNDLANFWEWYGSPAYPLKPATDAFRMGTNFVVHAMTH